MFKKFPKKRGYLKLLVYGDPGTEKTRRALRMPGPVYVIDLENGSTDYGDLLQDKDGYLLSTKSHIEVLQAIHEITRLPEGRVGTLIIDPITQVWQSLQQGHIEKTSRKKRCAPEDVFFDVATWGKLKRSYGDMMATMLSAPFHVIMTARGKERIDEKGRSQGYVCEAEKSTVYLANVVIEAHRDGDIIIKDRTGTHTKAERIPRVEFTTFLSERPRAQKMQSDSEAAEIDATKQQPQQHHPSFEPDRKKFCAQLGEMGLNYNEVAEWCTSLKRPRPSCMPQAQRDKLIAHLQQNQGALTN